MIKDSPTAFTGNSEIRGRKKPFVAAAGSKCYSLKCKVTLDDTYTTKHCRGCSNKYGH